MRIKGTPVWGAVLLAAVLLSGCSAAPSGSESAGQNAQSADIQEGQESPVREDTASVIVTMPATSEPASGFDPAYGRGAGEHMHEPLIPSTLTGTTTDL